MKACYLTISLLCACCVKGQVLHTLFSEAYNNPAAYSKRGTDASAFPINQAALSQVEHGSVAFYSEQKFLLKELHGGSAVLAFPGAGGGIGVALGVTGTDSYSNAQAGLAYGRALGKRISLGVQLDYYLVHTAGYGNRAAAGFQLGFLVHATDELFAGVQVSNPVSGKGPGEGEKLPAIYTMTFGYEPSENLILCVQTKKTENQPVDIRFALQYNFVHQFFVRAGLALSSSNLFTGFGLQWKNFRIDLIGNYHPRLGATPALQFILWFQKSGP